MLYEHFWQVSVRILYIKTICLFRVDWGTGKSYIIILEIWLKHYTNKLTAGMKMVGNDSNKVHKLRRNDLKSKIWKEFIKNWVYCLLSIIFPRWERILEKLHHSLHRKRNDDVMVENESIIILLYEMEITYLHSITISDISLMKSISNNAIFIQLEWDNDVITQ